MAELDLIIRKHVLKNAHDFGRASPGSVVGKVIAEWPDCKNDMKSTMVAINKEIRRVSGLSAEAIEKEMASFEYSPKKKEEKKSIELPGAEQGRVLTRFAPEPSGYPHIGHAKAAWLEYEGARNHGGKMILRFDDSNPEKESQLFVDAIKDGLAWLGIEWAEESYTSDHVPEIYKVAEQLIAGGRAYVCTASQQQISDSRTQSRPLPDRSLPPEEHLERWKQMLSGSYAKGEALLLFKGDLECLNTVMRDPALARIMDAPHYRQGKKYHVWPSYDLAVVYMDHAEQITHPMRSKEYELRDELYYALFDALGWKKPHMVPFSRLAIKRAPIGKRLIVPLVNEKKVMGWDDPRLPTLAGLRRRGILPQAIKDFVLSFGLSRVESEPDWEVLLAFNRKLLDPEAPHYFFVADPLELEVKGLEARTVQLKMHPKKDLGNREIIVRNPVFIAKSDASGLQEGEIFRLKDMCNVRLLKKGKKLLGELVPSGMAQKKIQWVSGGTECRVLVPKDLLDEKGDFDPKSLEEIAGLCEKSCLDLSSGDITQFERFGFVRLDSREPLQFIFSC